MFEIQNLGVRNLFVAWTAASPNVEFLALLVLVFWLHL